MAGWYLQIAALLQVFDTLIVMQPNTAIGFVLCGSALIAAGRGARRIVFLTGAGGALLGVVTLLERALAIDLSVNPILLGGRAGSLEPYVTQMAPATGVCFLFAGIALISAAIPAHSRIRAPLMGMAGVIIVGIGTVSFAGYLTGLTSTAAWGVFGGMAFYTALAFIVLGGGIVCLGWIAATSGGHAAPRWLPLLVGAGGLTATVVLWQALLASEELKFEQIVRNETINVHNRIVTHLNSTMFEFLRSATRWERFDVASSEKFQNETELLTQWLRGVRAVGWIDSTHHLRWIIPQGEYASLLGADLGADPRHRSAMATADQEGMALSAAGDATPGSDEYFIYAAVSDKQQRRGFLIGIFSAREMLDNLIEDEAFIGYSIAAYDGGREIYRRRGSDSQYFKWAQNSLLTIGKATWEVRVWPKAATMAALKSSADWIALATGLLATLLIAAVTYFAQTARLRAGQIEASNEQLQREIAERKETAARLADSEAQFRELFENAQDSISLISSDGKFSAVNPAFEAMSGFAASEWIGKSFTDMIHEEDLPRVVGYFEKLLQAKSIPNFELRFLTQSGEYRFAEVSASTRFRHGQIVGVTASARDITERMRAQEQIQLQLKRISALREINTAVTSTLDLDSVLSVLVDTIQRLLPYSALLVWLKDYETGELKRAACWNLDKEEWMGRNLPGIPKLTQAALEDRRAIVAADIQNDPRTFDRDFYHRNGLISYLGVPLVAQDEALGVLVFLTRVAHEFNDDEVTFLSSVGSQAAAAIHNSQLYEKIQNQARELERVNKLQADFAAMIVHDLRSPLANIMGIAEMMHDGLFGDTTEDQKSWLERMRNNAKNLVQLVSDFLDVSKLESGHIELHRSPTDVLELVRNIVVNYLPVAASKNIILTYRGDDALPPIDADPRRLDQVITNLLSNALKFTGAGGTVTIRLRKEIGDAVRIEVEDSGVGIQRSEISQLFQKYRQAGNARVLSQDGTGLGLVICKMIIEAHGGNISVVSEEGKGTKVTFTLPASCGPQPSSDADSRLNTIATPNP
jgi:PAS domain S-box-containing protein